MRENRVAASQPVTNNENETFKKIISVVLFHRNSGKGGFGHENNSEYIFLEILF